LETAPAAILSWLARRANRALPPVLVFAASGELEWIAREAGAISFRRDVIPGRELAAQCRRLLGKNRASQ
jgi:hypothetical protein